MKRLWAPWRMEYIGGEQRPGCLFCRVIENPDDPDADLVVWRPEGAIVILNKFPYNSGHLLVAPYRHVPNYEDIAVEEHAEMAILTGRCIQALNAEYMPQGYNIGLNQGTAAGAGIPDHVHFHVVPRWNGDTNFMAVIDDVKIVNEALDQTAKKLRQAFAAT